jgi:hypothetical protein
MNKVADFVYSNLRRFKKDKSWGHGMGSDQEQVLDIANKLEAAAKEPFNTRIQGSWDRPSYMEQYLQSLSKLSHGFGSIPSNYSAFADAMDTTPAGLAKFAKFILSTVRAYEERVKNMLASEVTGPLTAESAVTEAKPKAKSAWRTWDPYNYDEGGTPEYFQDLSAAILSYVSEKFGGVAWFKGGSYAYKVDASKPTTLVASDGSPIKCANVAKGLEDYCDRGTVPDFAEQDQQYWSEFFRPVKNKIPTARDGAPMYGSEQERHEIGESDGGASCSSAIAAGPVPSLFKAPVKRVKETVSQSPVPKQKKARK